MPVVHVLEHVEREGPGRIGEVARELGYEVVEHALYQGQPVPDGLGAGELLVVMGGPMSVLDLPDSRWPFLADEVRLLCDALVRGAPVLGVCLGAQLMAHAAGARLYPLQIGDPPRRHYEVGWGPIRFVPTAEAEPALAGLHDAEVVLHWHGDTFDLPPGAVLLASTLACPHQMFRLGPRAFGLQFHVEAHSELVRAWAIEDAEFVRRALGPGGVDRILQDTRECMAQHEQVGNRLLHNLLELMGSSS
jgi:GMP synthase (glutamine-hydrolysing)